LKKAEKLKLKLTRVTLADVLEKIDVTERLSIREKRDRIYSLKFHFLPRECYKDRFCVKPKDILLYFEAHFINKILLPGLKKEVAAQGMDSYVETNNSNFFHSQFFNFVTFSLFMCLVVVFSLSIKRRNRAKHHRERKMRISFWTRTAPYRVPKPQRTRRKKVFITEMKTNPTMTNRKLVTKTILTRPTGSDIFLAET